MLQSDTLQYSTEFRIVQHGVPPGPSPDDPLMSDDASPAPPPAPRRPARRPPPADRRRRRARRPADPGRRRCGSTAAPPPGRCWSAGWSSRASTPTWRSSGSRWTASSPASASAIPRDPDVTIERVEVDYALGAPWSKGGPRRHAQPHPPGPPGGPRQRARRQAVASARWIRWSRSSPAGRPRPDSRGPLVWSRAPGSGSTPTTARPTSSATPASTTAS